MAKCNKCLRGARVSVTGVHPTNTLRMDMGGAVLYVMPRGTEIEVVLNSENLTEGDYASATWDGERWIYTTGKSLAK